jgi:hypothetical protein
MCCTHKEYSGDDHHTDNYKWTMISDKEWISEIRKKIIKFIYFVVVFSMHKK